MNKKMPDDMFSEITLRDLYYILFRHKKKIIFFFLTVVIISSVITFSIPYRYISEASLLIKPGRESIEMIPTADSRRAISVSRSLSETLNNEIEILKSKEVYEELVGEIGIKAFLKKDTKLLDNISDDELPKIHEKVVSYLSKKVEVSTQRYSSIINISFVAKTPELANKVVSRLIEIFLKKHFDIHYSSGSYDFYNEQVVKSQKALEELEKELAELKNELNIGSVGENRAILLGRIGTLQEEKDHNNAAIAESQSIIEFVKNQLKNIPGSIEAGTIIGNENIQEEISSLRLREQELLLKFSEENVQVKEIRRQIAEAQKRLIDESQENLGINPNYQQLQQDLINEQTNFTSLKARSIELNKLLSGLEREMRQLNLTAIGVDKLEREKNIQSENYLKYMDSLEEARIDQIVQEQKLSNIQILQPPTFNRRPVASKRLRNIVFGFFIAFCGSLGLAFISEYLDHSMKRQEDVEKWLQLPTLVSIPKHPKEKLIFKEKLRA